MAEIEFWYEFASTYSYPAAMRIERLAETTGVTVRWRPFLLGPIFKTHGWNDSPFNIFAAKGRYMWRDLERICEAGGLPLKLPPFCFPQNGLKAARLALVGERDGWTPAFTRAVFAANYEQKDIFDDSVLAAILGALAVDAGAAFVAAAAPENKEARSSGKPRKPRPAACSARRHSPLARNCSGATTTSKRRSPGQDAAKPMPQAGRWRAA